MGGTEGSGRFKVMEMQTSYMKFSKEIIKQK